MNPCWSADRRNPAASRFEHQRAAPAAGLRVGDHARRSQDVERGRRFVHRPRRPRPLQQGDARELLAHDRPAVAAPDHGGAAERVAARERAKVRGPIRHTRCASCSALHGAYRSTGTTASCDRRLQRRPPPPRAEVDRRSDADEGEAQGQPRGRRSLSGPARCTTRRCRPRRLTARRRDE